MVAQLNVVLTFGVTQYPNPEWSRSVLQVQLILGYNLVDVLDALLGCKLCKKTHEGQTNAASRDLIRKHLTQRTH